MNFNDITIGIVTFKSEDVIFSCLKSIKYIKKIIIFDTSNDISLKKKIKKKYPYVNFILSKKNIGYGRANNRIFSIAKTPYVFILSPDTIMRNNCEKKLIKESKKIKNDFSIIAPFEKNINFGFFHDKKIRKKYYNLLEVDYVKGFAMLVNLKKIKKIGMFDRNIFLYLEEIDLCKRLNFFKEKIYICKNAKIKHLGAKSSNIGFEYEKCRNWHWMWSNVYFNKKFFSTSFAFKKFIFSFIKNLLKMILYFIIFQYKKSIISYMRMSGIFNSLSGNSSWYRPKIDKF